MHISVVIEFSLLSLGHERHAPPRCTFNVTGRAPTPKGASTTIARGVCSPLVADRAPSEHATAASDLGARPTASFRVRATTFCRRTWPRATSRPSASLICTSQSCWVRPRWSGRATTSTRPSVIERRKLVLLLTPTATRPCSAAAATAPMLAALSMALAYTPPWTMPHGWWCSGPRSMTPSTRSAAVWVMRRPDADTKRLAFSRSGGEAGSPSAISAPRRPGTPAPPRPAWPAAGAPATPGSGLAPEPRAASSGRAADAGGRGRPHATPDEPAITAAYHQRSRKRLNVPRAPCGAPRITTTSRAMPRAPPTCLAV